VIIMGSRIAHSALCLLLAGASALSAPVHECCLARQARGVIGGGAPECLEPPKPCGCCIGKPAAGDARRGEPSASEGGACGADRDDWCCRQGCCRAQRPGYHRWSPPTVRPTAVAGFDLPPNPPALSADGAPPMWVGSEASASRGARPPLSPRAASCVRLN
jgi:hypothetical protein